MGIAAISDIRLLCDRVFFAYAFRLSNIFFCLCLGASLGAAGPVFLGQNSCSSSSCHGGAGANQNQTLVWSRHDPHSRAPATLTTARSGILARVLGIPDATVHQRCTSCHTPWQGASTNLVSIQLRPAIEAVSCETCHGPASEWLRSHTRNDLNRAQKSLDGLRDLTILYNRANVCVACHQTIEPELLEAGHPELIFELDGQTAAMPRHWREKDSDTRPKAWLAGQAAALRELTAQLQKQNESSRISARTVDQWQAVLWLLSKTVPEDGLARFSTNIAASTNALKELHALSDKLVLRASSMSLNSNFVSKTLLSLVQTSSDFANAKNLPPLHASSRADRLVLALDRLVISLPASKRSQLNKNLDVLFRSVQNRQTFDPAAFAQNLRSFEAVLTAGP
jgi:hypothetical protein